MSDALVIRRAGSADLPAVVRLFAMPDEGNLKPDDDRLPLDARYEIALGAIARDPNNMLMVAELDGAIAGVFHLTFIQYVAYKGGVVAQIENVVVDPALRGQRIGERMMGWAIDAARRRGAYRVQLTTNKVRTRAHRFYARLGFVASHEGMKLVLVTDGSANLHAHAGISWISLTDVAPSDTPRALDWRNRARRRAANRRTTWANG